MRLHWNNVTAYSTGDELTYLNHTREIAARGWNHYREIVARYLADHEHWSTGQPNRYGYYALTTITFRLVGDHGFRTLSWLATICSMMALLATFLVAREMATTTGKSMCAILACALSISSPLQIAMGRRALTDEVFCMFFLFSLWALVRGLRQRAGFGWYHCLAIVLVTFCLAVRESTLLYLFVLAAIIGAFRWYSSQRTTTFDLLILVTPPILSFSCLALLVGLPQVLQLAWIISTMQNSYIELLQSGPPHRIFLDLFALSPLVMLTAVVAVAVFLLGEPARNPKWQALAIGFVAILLVFGLFPTKNVRFVIMADPLARLLVAGLLTDRFAAQGTWSGLRLILTIGALNAFLELAIFHQVFIAGGTYDPVTAELLGALKMIPLP